MFRHERNDIPADNSAMTEIGDRPSPIQDYEDRYGKVTPLRPAFAK